MMPKWGQDGAKKSQEEANMGPGDSKMMPRGPQDKAKMNMACILLMKSAYFGT